MEAYQQTVQYLYESLPMFQRVGAAAYKKDLSNTWALCEVVGNPHKLFKSIHVAGTNGKGSSSHMLAAVLQAAGYKTGLYTSPHLKEFTERIKVNGKEVSEEFVVAFVQKMRPTLDQVKPSFFETTVVMAFDYFARERVDVAVIEVGLGGRLDSTNVITPEVSLITNIGWDHMDLLGDTLQKIAYEKAGIIKPGIPIVISERQPEVQIVFEEKASETGSKILFATDQYHITPIREGNYSVTHAAQTTVYELELKGSYQEKNLAGVLSVLDEMRQKGFSIAEQAVTEGLKKTVQLTGLKGRWQQLGERPLTVCDTGHNEPGVREVLHQIDQQKFNKLHIVWGSVRDKDIDRVLALLPKNAHYYFCAAHIARAMPAAQLQEKAATFGLHGDAVTDVNEAIAKAKQNAAEDDMIFIGGSTFVVAEIFNL
ncbi:MAG: bifunctional folylpolyglutamate synthase/dihydrofolate synthase [Bacteroidetes bacterium]|nr:bifunctional folylpolyglutamate synthase/dihydrofolate synthase [Bacteroidota bacterium]MBS1539753.1 bifunctional folylpolyglutamate synthase/dihydrofolate synthase [Bacteroidota bacterium]